MGSTAKVNKEDVAKRLDARIRKIAGVSFETVQCALSEALREKYPPENGGDGCCPSYGPWLRDVFDDVAIFSNDGKLYRIAYTFSGNTATLSGEPEEVQVTYAPVGAAAGAAPQTPDELVNANTQKGRAIIAKRFDATLARLAGR